MTRTFIVVPVYKEDPQVVYETLQKLTNHFEQVVVVNDGGDPLLMESLKELPVHYLRHEINLGQGAALQTGTEYALEKGAALIGHFDADGQHFVEDLQQMILFLQQNELDVVLGSRFLSPEHSKMVPFRRKMVLKGAIFINFIFSGILLTDAHNGLRLLNQRAARLMEIRENRQLHASEILWLLKKHQLRFREFPVKVVYNAYSLGKGQKNYHSVKIFKDLIISRLIK